MTPKSSAKGAVFAIGAFVFLGTVAALWDNPLFVRMTPTDGFEVGLLALQALLLGVYVAIPVPGCATKLAGVGGIANFIGIACPICNKLLLLVFSADALLTYLEPARVYFAAGGALITAFAVFIRWRNLQALTAGRNPAAAGQDQADLTPPPRWATVNTGAAGATASADLRSES